MTNTTEKWWVCPKCMWIPRAIEDQSTICPKCANECVQVDYVDKKNMAAWLEDLKRKHSFHMSRH